MEETWRNYIVVGNELQIWDPYNQSWVMGLILDIYNDDIYIIIHDNLGGYRTTVFDRYDPGFKNTDQSGGN